MFRTEREKSYVEAVGLLSLTCLGLFIARLVATGTPRYWFIPENLLLAWLSLALAQLLISELKKHRWLSWQNLSISLLWLLFLPNSFYVLTDFIHVYPTGEVSEIYDICLIGTLVLAGFTLGFTSLYLVHEELLKRFKPRLSTSVIAGVLLLSSFAVYLGRQLRWSTWDVITDPGGIILNVTDRIVDPSRYPGAFNTTALFFVLLVVTYYAIRHIVRPVRKQN